MIIGAVYINRIYSKHYYKSQKKNWIKILGQDAHGSHRSPETFPRNK